MKLLDELKSNGYLEIPDPWDKNFTYLIAGNGAGEMANTEIQFQIHIYNLIKEKKFETIVELGTGHGLTTAFMATSCKENGCGHIVSIEKHAQILNAAKRLLEILNLTEYVTLKNENTATAKIDKSIDFLFIDSDHIHDHVVNEINNYKNNLKPGSIVAFHDNILFSVVEQATKHLEKVLPIKSCVQLSSGRGLKIYEIGG